MQNRRRWLSGSSFSSCIIDSNLAFASFLIVSRLWIFSTIVFFRYSMEGLYSRTFCSSCFFSTNFLKGGRMFPIITIVTSLCFGLSIPVLSVEIETLSLNAVPLSLWVTSLSIYDFLANWPRVMFYFVNVLSKSPSKALRTLNWMTNLLIFFKSLSSTENSQCPTSLSTLLIFFKVVGWSFTSSIISFTQ